MNIFEYVTWYTFCSVGYILEEKLLSHKVWLHCHSFQNWYKSHSRPPVQQNDSCSQTTVYFRPSSKYTLVLRCDFNVPFSPKGIEQLFTYLLFGNPLLWSAYSHCYPPFFFRYLGFYTLTIRISYLYFFEYEVIFEKKVHISSPPLSVAPLSTVSVTYSQAWYQNIKWTIPEINNS